MQIHELNNFNGTPGATNFLAIDDGSDTSRISGEALLDPVNSRIDNLTANVLPDSVETILDWADVESASKTLTKNVSGFDYLDLYFKENTSGTNRIVFAQRYPRAAFPAQVTIPVISWGGGTDPKYLYFQDLMIAISGTTLTMSQLRIYSWDGKAADGASIEPGILVDQIRVDGVKISSNTSAELTDLRTGPDGVVHRTARAAVIAQYNELMKQITMGSQKPYYYRRNYYELTGYGSNGQVGGVTKVGDTYYNTNTALLRRAVSPNGSDYNYETIPWDPDGIYFFKSDSKYRIPVYASNASQIYKIDTSQYFTVNYRVPYENYLKYKLADYYPKVMKFVGIGGNGGINAGVKNIGDIYFNTSTGAFAVAIRSAVQVQDVELTDFTYDIVYTTKYDYFYNLDDGILYTYDGSALNPTSMNFSDVGEPALYRLYGKVIEIQGFGGDGLNGGVQRLGETYFNTSSNLLRRAIGWSNGLMTYETIPFDDNALYYAKGWLNYYHVIYNGNTPKLEGGYPLRVTPSVPLSHIIEKFRCETDPNVLVIVGTGTGGGLTCGVRKVGDVFYNATSGLFRKADGLLAHDFSYVTVPAVYSYYYNINTGKYYTFSDGTFTETTYTPPASDDSLEVESIPKRFSFMKDFGTQPAANGSAGSFANMSQGYNELINNVYEPLRLAHPEYITRENVGRDASDTYDIYVYTFAPRYYQQSILLVAGVHANEPDAIACLARFAQLVTNNPDDDEDLKFIRENVKLTLIPCVNVWGFSQSPKSRTNANGEIMQQWDLTNPPQEIAVLRPKILALKDELSYILDMHTTTNNTYKDFYGVINKHDKNVRTIFRTNAWLCENYAKNGATVDDQYLGYLENYPGILSIYFHDTYGLVTSTMELSDYYWDSVLSSSPVITMGVTMFGNYIIQQINDFYKTMHDIPDGDYRPSRS